MLRIAVHGPTIEAQFARRPPPSRRPANMPLTTSALDQIPRPIVTALYPRRYGLKNRERLNRLLMLLQLHVDGDDDVQRYAVTIRRWLEAHVVARPRAGAQSQIRSGRPPCADLSENQMRRGAAPTRRAHSPLNGGRIHPGP